MPGINLKINLIVLKGIYLFDVTKKLMLVLYFSRPDSKFNHFQSWTRCFNDLEMSKKGLKFKLISF